MQRTKPPFRADMVGSLLRTQLLKDAREKHRRGEISDVALKEVEDREIRALIKRQEEIGLQAVTDGEFRRAFWHFDFLEHLDGVTAIEADAGMHFQGGITITKAMRVTGKIGFSVHPMLDHFRFVKDNTSRIAKMTIPGPSMLHYRGGRKMMNAGLYPNMDAFYADLGAAYAKAVRAFYDAGCRYLQLDDISFAYLCDPKQREMLRERGDDPDKQPDIYAGLVRHALQDKPADLTVTMHLCRGNFRSTFIASGGYDPVAELLFNAMPIDGYFMESTRTAPAASSPCAFCPRGEPVVPWARDVEDRNAREERRRRASHRGALKHADLDELALGPRSGFASAEEGNVLAEDEQ